MDIKENILGTIGNTPMVRINRLNPNPDVNIFAKLEGFNPTGSIKDRIALKMIEDAENDGRLRPGQTIIEPTSGNTGIGLAIIGIIKGYPVEIVMSDAVSVERRKIIRSYGAAVTLTPGAEGTDGAIRLARKKVSENPGRYFMPDQFKNAANYLTHYQSTALEIWQQTGGKIDYLVCALGTSGTIMGLSRFLKVMKPDIKVVCAHPVRGHYIQGLKNMEEAIVPAIYDPEQIDIQEMIESEEAITMARRIISEEAIFAGMSSGAAMLAAIRTARRIDKGNIVVVFPDRAEKYLSTGMFSACPRSSSSTANLSSCFSPWSLNIIERPRKKIEALTFEPSWRKPLACLSLNWKSCSSVLGPKRISFITTLAALDFISFAFFLR